MESRSSSSFAWLRTGEDALHAMLGAIERSRVSVRLEIYIFTQSNIGQRFLDALVRARARGVEVRVLVDSVGSITLPESFWDPLRQAGSEVRWFNPFKLMRWSYRDHRKILVCDEEAFIGGVNIADEYAGDGVTHGWRDLGLRITGGLVQELADTFDAYFARADFRFRERLQLRKAQKTAVAGPDWRLLLSDSTRHRGELRRSLVRDLGSARSVRIICAYFLPPWRLRKKLVQIQKRGGKVQLILPGQSDVLLAQLATRRIYQVLLRSGIEIFEYQPQVLHAKLFIMDDVVYAGSANLDIRSLRLNHELLVRVASRQLAGEAVEMFEHDLRHCRRIDRASWRASRTVWNKLREDWAYFFLVRVDPYLARLQQRWL